MEKELSEKAKDLFILNENMNDIIKIIKSLEHSNVLIDGITETVKHKIKKEGEFLSALLASLIALLVQSVIYSVVDEFSAREVRRAGSGYMDKNFKFCSIL